MAFKDQIDLHFARNDSLDEVDRKPRGMKFKSIAKIDDDFAQIVQAVHSSLVSIESEIVSHYDSPALRHMYLPGRPGYERARVRASSALEKLNCKVSVPGKGLAFIYCEESTPTTINSNGYSWIETPFPKWPSRLAVSLLFLERNRQLARPVHAFVDLPPCQNKLDPGSLADVVLRVASHIDRWLHTGNDEDVCAICQEFKKANDFLVTLDCKHRFHCGCIHQLKQEIPAHSLACPLCRVALLPL